MGFFQIIFAWAVDFRKVELGKTIAFSQSQSGFSQLLFWIKALMKKHSKHQVLFGRELTGYYWLSLAEFLEKHGIKLVIVNPMPVKERKELDDNSPNGWYSELQVPEGMQCRTNSSGMEKRD
ncbi:IS110 family transposase [Thermoactinomyces sp. CICC 10522]|jgi:transposase|uniref:IS110 family transposase n=1 Tax=Thermoactinomyces sp. CICC 10522 TaxID=2767427 RepID=UPI0021027D99|nr:IS110 family transposase [Thermoactinomyces sp. CICC 10522]